MRCPVCEARLNITHVYAVDGGKTQGAECAPCGKRFTFVTFLVGEIVNRGDGPYAIAKRLRLGEDPRSL